MAVSSVSGWPVSWKLRDFAGAPGKSDIFVVSYRSIWYNTGELAVFTRRHSYVHSKSKNLVCDFDNFRSLA